jgi:hypothetical protein
MGPMLREREGIEMGQAPRKVTAEDANEKLAHRRLTVFELVDTFGSYAFGLLYVSKRPEAAVVVLHKTWCRSTPGSIC